MLAAKCQAASATNAALCAMRREEGGFILATKCNKPVTRICETALVRDMGKLKRLVVTIYPNGTLGLRPEKTRREEAVLLTACYGLAIKQRVAKERADKKGKRK